MDVLVFSLEITKYNAGKEDIVSVGEHMGRARSLADAMELPEFKSLTKNLQTPNENKEDLATLLLTLNRVVIQQLRISQNYSIDSIYQDLCKSKYSHYKARLEQDISRLENDVRILCSMERKQPVSV